MTDILNDSDMSGIFQSVTEVSKATPYKINVGFVHRYNVWRNEILPGRLLSIRQDNSVEYVQRMQRLVITDANRLIRRAMKEYSQQASLNAAIENVDITMETEIRQYRIETQRINTETKGDTTCTQ